MKTTAKKREFKITRKSFRFLLISLIASLTLYSCEESELLPEEEEEILPPIELACDFFSQDRILVNDPNRPVDYIVGCWANVQGSLKIEPGVVIAFAKDAGLYVNLKEKLFEIKGTASDPVILTGFSKQKGYWRGLFFAEAYNTSNLIEHAVIEYAGSQNLTTSSPVYEGSLALRGVSGTPPQALNLNHVAVKDGGSVGLDFHGIRKNATVSTSNLVITGNEDVSVKVSAEMAHIFDSSSSYTGNASDFVNITTSYYEIEDKTVSWQKLNVPYLIDGRIHVKKEGHLTIEAGVEMEFKSNAYIQVAALLPPYNVSLRIEGTENEPVHLKAHNGTSWGGIYFSHSQEDNLIDHTIIEKAKGDFPVGNLENSGAIYMHADPKVTVRNSSFMNLPNYAFYAYTGASATQPPVPNLSRLNITYNNVAKGSAEMGHLGWGNGRSNHHP